MLSRKCQYALHALKFIANQSLEKTALLGGRIVTVKEITENENIPKKFLSVILADLKTAGILSSERGKTGGYYLRRNPTTITVLEVIRVIDGAVAMLPCVSLNFYQSCGLCADEATCGVNGIFTEVRDETLKILSTTTIAQL